MEFIRWSSSDGVWSTFHQIDTSLIRTISLWSVETHTESSFHTVDKSVTIPSLWRSVVASLVHLRNPFAFHQVCFQKYISFQILFLVQMGTIRSSRIPMAQWQLKNTTPPCRNDLYEPELSLLWLVSSMLVTPAWLFNGGDVERCVCFIFHVNYLQQWGSGLASFWNTTPLFWGAVSLT